MSFRSRRRRRAYCAEPLERRVLLATISGTVYNDLNADAARNPFTDLGLGGWTVYVDANENGVLDGSELNTASAANGAWSITSAGFRTRDTYHIRIVNQPGWRPTEPAAGEYAVSFSTLSDTVAGLDFGQTRRALVQGTVFHDTNDDGTWDREPVQSGRTVFADANDNGLLDAGEVSDVTDFNGDYALSPAAGAYTIRQVQQAGWWQTHPSPPSAGHPLTLANAQSVSGRHFGNIVATVDLVGAGFGITSAFDPVPADGRIEVLYQIRNNGTADSGGFRVAFYLSDDATITPSDRLLRSIAQGGIPRHATVDRTTALTLPTPDPLQTDNQYFVGMMIDSDGEVAETNEANNANQGLLADRFPVSSEADLPTPSNNTTVLAKPIDVGGTAAGAIGDEWIGGLDQDIYRLPVTAGHELQITADGMGSPVMIRLYNSAWSLLRLTTAAMDYTVPSNDTYYVVLSSGGNGLNDPRRLTGRTEGPTGPYTLTVGARNGIDITSVIGSWGGNPPDSPLMNFRITGVPYNRPFDVALYLSDDDQVTPADRFITTVRVTQADYNHEFDYHIVRPEFTLPAVDPFVTDNEYWVGLVLDSSYEIPERDETNNFNQGAGIDRKSWQSERNIGSPADGQTASSYSSTGFGNPLPLSIGDEWIGPYDQDFTPVSANANETLNFDVDRTSGTLDSYIRLYDSAWNFLAGNDNGAAPGEAAGLDSFLRYSFSVAGGYWVVVSGRGNHTNHPLLLTGRSAASTGDLTLTTTSDPAGDVTGVVFHDADADGVQDPEEPGLAGRRVYIDNGDERFQDNEPSVLTDADGLFRFIGLRPSTYAFRTVAPAGWIPTAPATGSHTLVLTSGQPAGPIAFGAIEQVTFSGTAFNDVDADGTRDAGESGRPGVVAYADLNNNGVRDLSTVTISLGGLPAEIRAGYVAIFALDGPLAHPLVIADVDVLLDVRNEDYDAFLRHGGAHVQLLDVPVLLFVRRDAWRIDDEAATTTGLHRRPIDPLSALDGTSAAGKWWLYVDDHRNPGTFGFGAPHGDLYSFALSLMLSEPFSITDASGAYTIDNLFPGDYHIRAEGEPDWIPTAPGSGVYDVTLEEGGSATGVDFGARQRRLQIAGRHVFYNNSAFDGRDPAPNAADDGAIATDKTPLAPGGGGSHTNITSYDKGINGLMIDVYELPAAPTLSDFAFKAPSSFNPGVWLDVPAPSAFAVRDLPGDNHARRVTFTWPDHLLRNVWLQFSVLANAATRRTAPDIFYVGNLVGETADVFTPTRVSAADLTATRAASSRARASLTNRFDHNRDGLVNVLDQAIVRGAMGHTLPAPVAPSSASVAGTATARNSRPAARTGWAAGLLDDRRTAPTILPAAP